MKIIEFKQGTKEWKDHRAKHYNASDAPAMLSCSKYKTRENLLLEKVLGTEQEFNDQTMKLFENGHRFESLARSKAEEIIGQELYPVVGYDGKLSASFDGLTIDDRIAWEHKTLNKEIKECLYGDMNASNLPLHYRAQMQHQMIVSGCEKILFTASSWTDEGELIDIVHAWYYNDEELSKKIKSGWEVFEEDLILKSKSTLDSNTITMTAKEPNSLPAIFIEISGQVTASNLSVFKDAAIATINSINKELITDQDFADAEAAIKWCSNVESKLSAAKEHALSQTASIDELFKTIDDISAEARRIRLDLDKLVKAKKEDIKNQILLDIKNKFDLYIQELNEKIGKKLMPIDLKTGAADAIKGKKTITGIKDAADAALSNAKIEAKKIFDLIISNLLILEKNKEFSFLFPDLSVLVLKQNEDMAAVVSNRILTHKTKKEEKKQEEAILIAQQQQQSEKNILHKNEINKIDHDLSDIGNNKTINLGEINNRLGFIVSSDFLHDLGFEYLKNGASKMYYERDFNKMCKAISYHLDKIISLSCSENL